MGIVDDLLTANRRYAEQFDKGHLGGSPSKRLAVVTCMDARINVYAALGLEEGQAHVIRNAGGVVTDDVIRCLVISQRLLGTRAIVVIQHTECGMLTFRDDELRDQIEAEVGIRPPLAFEAFRDLEQNVRQSIARLQASPFIPNKNEVRGFIYDVRTGRLHNVR
ncbi:MAG TPA: carbonic anhydrase [Bacillota bacterium]